MAHAAPTADLQPQTRAHMAAYGAYPMSDVEYGDGAGGRNDAPRSAPALYMYNYYQQPQPQPQPQPQSQLQPQLQSQLQSQLQPQLQPQLQSQLHSHPRQNPQASLPPTHHPGTSTGPAPARAPSTLAVASKHVRRRMRMITSCLECRRRKLKCDKLEPCKNCTGPGPVRECLYLGPKLDEAGQLRLAQIKEKVGSLEKQLESTAKPRRAKVGGRSVDDGDGDDPEEGNELLPTDMVALEVTYEYEGDEGDGADDITDVGVLVGKMRLTDRIGGMARPRLSQEINDSLSGIDGPETSYNHVDPIDTSTWPSFLKPSSMYMPPSSGLLLGQPFDSASSSHQPSPFDYLPSQEACDRLIEHYFVSVHPVARCVHWPTFERAYVSFWVAVSTNHEPRRALVAVVFAALFSAAASLDEPVALREFNVARDRLCDGLKMGVETSLCRAGFLRTTKVEAMQAFVMYMIPLCRGEVSRSHSVLVGAAIRMAQCMGLHRDGEAYGLDPVYTHTRRLIWYQLCFLDVRTCEVHGPAPTIRREDFDTRFPLNIEDEEIVASQSQSQSPSAGGGRGPWPTMQWTSALLAVIRFEINEMMRTLWIDRRRMQAGRTVLTSVLAKIEAFRKRLLSTYGPLIPTADSGATPLQMFTRLVLHLLLHRLHLMILHTFHTNGRDALPARLSSLLIAAAIGVTETAMRLETDPLYAPWKWYVRTFSQYHGALLLGAEVFWRPDTPEAARIWPILEYVFNLDPSEPPDVKGRRILDEAATKTALYCRIMGTRAPTTIARAVPSRGNPLGGLNDSSREGSQDNEQEQEQPPQQQFFPPSSSPQYRQHQQGPRQAASDPASHAPSGVNLGEPVDWDVFNTLFPPDPATGQLNLAGLDTFWGGTVDGAL